MTESPKWGGHSRETKKEKKKCSANTYGGGGKTRKKLN